MDPPPPHQGPGLTRVSPPGARGLLQPQLHGRLPVAGPVWLLDMEGEQQHLQGGAGGPGPGPSPGGDHHHPAGGGGGGRCGGGRSGLSFSSAQSLKLVCFQITDAFWEVLGGPGEPCQLPRLTYDMDAHPPRLFAFSNKTGTLLVCGCWGGCGPRSAVSDPPPLSRWRKFLGSCCRATSSLMTS